MTTSLSRSGQGRARTCTALAVALLPWAAPSAAQELALPSGLVARLYDVVLEEGAGTRAPDAGSEIEVVEAAPADEDIPLNQPSSDAAGGDAGSGGLARFRLVVDGLGGEGAGYDRVAADFLWLCERMALPALDANGWSPAEVVVALSDRETEFGIADPEAVQYFEGFRVSEGTCVPQAF